MASGSSFTGGPSSGRRGKCSTSLAPQRETASYVAAGVGAAKGMRPVASQ